MFIKILGGFNAKLYITFDKNILMRTVKQGSVVDVDYEGRLDGGRLFDTSKESVAKDEGIYAEGRDYEPLHITVGQGTVIKGFENALIGMEEEEEKTVLIKSDDAYGKHKEELVKEFDKDPIRDKKLKVGMILMVNVGERDIPARVVGVSDKISLDFNHTLAGKDLTFKINVVKIE